MLYVNEPPEHKLVLVPVMLPGCAITELTVTDLAALSPQVLYAFTDTVPETNGVGNYTLQKNKYFNFLTSQMKVG